MRLIQAPQGFPYDPPFDVVNALANVLTVAGAFGFAYLGEGPRPSPAIRGRRAHRRRWSSPR